MTPNYRILKAKKLTEPEGLFQYTLERLEPGKVDSFRFTCPEIKGATVGMEVAVDIKVQIAFVLPGATVEDVGNTKPNTEKS